MIREFLDQVILGRHRIFIVVVGIYRGFYFMSAKLLPDSQIHKVTKDI